MPNSKWSCVRIAAFPSFFFCIAAFFSHEFNCKYSLFVWDSKRLVAFGRKPLDPTLHHAPKAHQSLLGAFSSMAGRSGEERKEMITDLYHPPLSVCIVQIILCRPLVTSAPPYYLLPAVTFVVDFLMHLVFLLRIVLVT